VIAGLVLLFVGPKIVILFPLWLLGAACCHLAQRLQLNVKAGVILALMPIIVFAVCKKEGMEESAPNGQLELSIRYFGQFTADYITATCFAVHLLGISDLFCGASSRHQRDHADIGKSPYPDRNPYPVAVRSDVFLISFSLPDS